MVTTALPRWILLRLVVLWRIIRQWSRRGHLQAAGEEVGAMAPLQDKQLEHLVRGRGRGIAALVPRPRLGSGRRVRVRVRVRARVRGRGSTWARVRGRC